MYEYCYIWCIDIISGLSASRILEQVNSGGQASRLLLLLECPGSSNGEMRPAMAAAPDAVVAPHPWAMLHHCALPRRHRKGGGGGWRCLYYYWLYKLLSFYCFSDNC